RRRLRLGEVDPIGPGPRRHPLNLNSPLRLRRSIATVLLDDFDFHARLRRPEVHRSSLNWNSPLRLRRSIATVLLDDFDFHAPASPPDVRQGCALPVSSIIETGLCPRCGLSPNQGG